MRSQKLEGYFATNPREKDLLARNDQPVALKLHSSGMADVPEYMGLFRFFSELCFFSTKNITWNGFLKRAKSQRKERK